MKHGSADKGASVRPSLAVEEVFGTVSVILAYTTRGLATSCFQEISLSISEDSEGLAPRADTVKKRRILFLIGANLYHCYR
jgi:hypothetical protein